MTADVAVPMTAHAVHLIPQFRVDRVKTFDPARGDRKQPAGEDAVEAWTQKTMDPATGLIEIVEHPEIRTPYWEFDDTVSVGRPTDCPDCTRGLSAKDDLDDFGPFLHCVQVDRENYADPCHTGCLVACGKTA